MRRKTDASLHDKQYFPLMRRESRHMYFPLLRWEYKSNIAVCCICSHCCGGNICRSTTQILQLIVKKQKFVQLLTLWVCLFLRNRGWGTRQKKLQRSSEYHERGLQSWTMCITKHLPTCQRCSGGSSGRPCCGGGHGGCPCCGGCGRRSCSRPS